MIRCFLFLAALVTLAMVPSCKSSSPPQREVVLYCSVDQEIAEPIIVDFEKRTGIKVRANYDVEASKTVGLLQKIRSEAANPAADVFWSNEVFYTISLAREGLLAPYNPGEPWPEQYCDAKMLWHGFALRARVISYNPDRTPPAMVPLTLEDLLNDRWKGQIAMAQPEFGTTGGDIASWFVHYGPDKAKEILRGLKANGVRLVAGNSLAARAVVNGQVQIGLTDSDDVYAQQRNGQALERRYLDQGGDGVLTIPHTAALVKGGPHSAEAAELMKYLLSDTVEEALARSDAHATPIRPALAEKFPRYAIEKPLKIDYEKVADHLNEAIIASQDILKD